MNEDKAPVPAEAERQRAQQRKGRLVMLAIIAAFVLPFFVLPLLMSPEALRKTNKGTLIDPHVVFAALHATDASGRVLEQPPSKKWFMVYVLPSPCEGDCVAAREHALFAMRQMPLTLGRDGDRVLSLVVETRDPAPDVAAALQAIRSLQVVHAEADAVDAAFAALPGRASAAGNLYLMSPDGYLFIYYAPEAERSAALRRADDMGSDLKKSLKGSRI